MGSLQKVTRVMSTKPPGTQVLIHADVQGITGVTLFRYPQHSTNTGRQFEGTVQSDGSADHILYFSADILEEGRSWDMFIIAYQDYGRVGFVTSESLTLKREFGHYCFNEFST